MHSYQQNVRLRAFQNSEMFCDLSINQKPAMSKKNFNIIGKISKLNMRLLLGKFSY